MRPGRDSPSSPLSRLARPSQLALALLLALSGLVGATSPASAEPDPDVSVRITGVSPTTLERGATVTLTGTVTNTGDERWTKAQAYLVIAPSPFTTRGQVTDAVESQTSYTGTRVVDLDSIDEIGTLAPGTTRPFRVRVPYRRLGVSGAKGVYPVGVQILATAEDGTRDTTAVARATTFLPAADDDAPAAPGGFVWPFVLPDRIGADGRWSDPVDLLERVSPGGQLRHLLDQARSGPRDGTTLVLDPALLVALDDLVDGRRLPDDVQPTDAQREAATAFLDELTDLSRRVATWTLGYGRPDVLAIEGSGDARALDAVVEEATTSTLEQFQVTGRRVVWPTRTGVTSDLLERSRGGGEQAVIVSRDAVPDWRPRLGSVVLRPTDAGPVPLFVNAGLDVGVPGTRTVATLRQRLLAEAAFAALERRRDAGSRADAFVLIDPTWDPGEVTSGGFTTAFEPDVVAPSDLEDLLATDRADYAGEVPQRAQARPLGTSQLRGVERLVSAAAVLADLAVDGTDLEIATSRTAAGLLSVEWRSDPTAGARAARAAASRAENRLEGLSVEGPPAITLSSDEGSFPLTISNDTDGAVRVGLRIGTSNPALSVPDVEPVEVEAGERRTVTVSVDLGDQTTSTLTARVITPSGMAVGQPDSFNVRSSRVGAALWVLIGAAGLFVLFALARRFLRGRGRGEQVERGEPDE